MKRLNFVSISMVVALLAGVVAFSACVKDDDPAEEGKRAAKALCDCWKQASANKYDECVDKVSKQYEKWWKSNDKFWEAIVLYNCDATEPSWWDEDEYGKFDWLW